MPGNKIKKQCPHNEGVYCSDETCDYCGWNPAGRKKREAKPMNIPEKKDFLQKEKGNGRKRAKNNTSGYTGVYWNRRRQKWNAEIRKDGKRYNLGGFDTFEDAVNARRLAEEEKKQNAK